VIKNKPIAKLPLSPPLLLPFQNLSQAENTFIAMSIIKRLKISKLDSQE
jgi:hypothetical protein